VHIRRQIAAIIDQIDPLDEKESQHKNLALGWIESGAELFRIKKPATPKMHLVSYFVPIDVINKKILLVHHKKANLWIPPGGHVDINEHPKTAAAREMEEELFTKALFLADQPMLLSVTKTHNDLNPHTDVSLWYLVEGNSTTDYCYDEKEFHQIRWFSMDKISEKEVEPHLSRFLNKLEKFINVKTNLSTSFK